MLPIYMLWVGVIVLMIRLLVKLRRKSATPVQLRAQNEQVLYIGSFAFLLGLLGHIVALFDAFKILETMEKVSQQFILEGLWISLLAPVYGFILFSVSSVFWFFVNHHLKGKTDPGIRTNAKA